MNLYNLTPHEITIYDEEGKKVIDRIPSSGELRLSSCAGPIPPMPSILTVNGVRVPVVPRQVFTGLDENGPGFKLLKPGNQVIVSMVVGDYMSKLREYDNITLLGSGSGPNTAVREGGKILGTKALEYYAPESE